MSDIFSELTLFDSAGHSPDVSTIVLWAAIILLVSQTLFLVLTKLMGMNDVSQNLETEKNKEYKTWAAKGVSPWFVLFCDVVNSSLYGPIVEEFVFRFLLMKKILVEVFHFPPQHANVIQAAVFGSMHMTNSVFSVQSVAYSNLQALSSGISGLVSGWVYIQSNSILPSLLSHMLNNFLASSSEVYGYMKYLQHQSTTKTK